MLNSSVIVVLLLGATFGLSATYSTARRSVPPGAQASLTKLITSGNIAKAQEEARVNPPLFDVESYAHFLTVNDQYNSNLFFWYFPVTTGDPNAPLVLWLQGGPGTSSLLGLFSENGPVSIGPDLKPIPRLLSWNKKVNIVYIDNPVGAGFSYTENEKGYSKNMNDVGTNLYSALIQFLQLFPDLQKKPFFLTGESYAGKYIPTLGHFIHTNNPTANLKVNLQGLAIGNGFTDPPNMMDFSNHFYQIGLIDKLGKAKFEAMEVQVAGYIATGQWSAATDVFEAMMANPPTTEYNSLFTNLTGFFNVYNFLQQNETVRYWIEYVNQPHIKNALHIYDRSYSYGAVVKSNFDEEMLKSSKPFIEELLSSGLYRVLIYIGELDCLIPPKQVHDYTETIIFPQMAEYHLAKRYKWWVGDTIAGYVKTAGQLTDLVVRNAGHMVPQDQPEFGWDLIDRFINDKKFSDTS